MQIDAPASGIDCEGGTMCGDVCCIGTCEPLGGNMFQCTGKTFACDGPEDCATGEVCCNDTAGSQCSASSCSGGNNLVVCHSAVDCTGTCTDCGLSSDHDQYVCCE